MDEPTSPDRRIAALRAELASLRAEQVRMRELIEGPVELSPGRRVPRAQVLGLVAFATTVASLILLARVLLLGGAVPPPAETVAANSPTRSER